MTPRYRFTSFWRKNAAYHDFPWDKTLCFFGDERHVPPNDPDSNYLQASKILFKPVASLKRTFSDSRARFRIRKKPRQIMKETLRVLFPEKECLKGYPRFDVLLLGLGANGHTASLFPCTKALHEKAKWAVANKSAGTGEASPDDDLSCAECVA